MKILLFLSIFCSFWGCKEKTLEQLQAKLDKRFEEQAQKPILKEYFVENRKLTSFEIGNDKADLLIVLLHGSPGSSKDYYDYMKDTTLIKNAKIMAIDRPGYGLSEFGNSYPNVLAQSKLIEAIINQNLGSKKLILVGYSFGGPVAAVLASMFKNQTKGLLLLAGSIEPGAEKTFGISYLADKKIVRPLVPPILKMANDEKLTHKASLEEITPLLNDVICKVTILHGDKDNIIYYSNAAYTKTKMTNADVKIITLEGKGHGFFFNEFGIIKKYLIELID